MSLLVGDPVKWRGDESAHHQYVWTLVIELRVEVAGVAIGGCEFKVWVGGLEGGVNRGWDQVDG